jgi:hypothetical protein
VSCPDTAKAGQPVTFTANVSDSNPNVTPSYNWTVSAGTITNGQGTSSIKVNTTGWLNTSSVTATVDVGGYDRECSTSDSCMSSIYWPTLARMFDKYGNVRPGNEQARLDNFAIELQTDPTAQGWIVVYAPAR